MDRHMAGFCRLDLHCGFISIVSQSLLAGSTACCCTAGAIIIASLHHVPLSRITIIAHSCKYMIWHHALVALAISIVVAKIIPIILMGCQPRVRLLAVLQHVAHGVSARTLDALLMGFMFILQIRIATWIELSTDVIELSTGATATAKNYSKMFPKHLEMIPKANTSSEISTAGMAGVPKAASPKASGAGTKGSGFMAL